MASNYLNGNLGVGLPNISSQISRSSVLSDLLTAFGNGNGEIRLILKTLDDNVFRLEISDSGKGISQEVLDKKLYNMGLELVEILGEQLNAKISIDNKEGSNFTFIFTRSQ